MGYPKFLKKVTANFLTCPCWWRHTARRQWQRRRPLVHQGKSRCNVIADVISKAAIFFVVTEYRNRFCNGNLHFTDCTN